MSFSTWEDLTTRFLAQFFPPGRTAKLHNDILMFQQHQGESISEAWTRFKDLLPQVPHHASTFGSKSKSFMTMSIPLQDEPSISRPVARNPVITKGSPLKLKIPCNISHVHVEKAYIDLNSPLNVMTRMMYNWIMRRKLDPREETNRGDVGSIIDPRLSQVVLGKPFVEISNMTHDPPEKVVRKKNKGKSQTTTSTLPESQGPEASRELSKKRQNSKSKNPPTETKDELEKESDEEEVLAAEEDMDEDPQVAEEVKTPSQKKDQREPSHAQESTYDSSSPDLKKFDNVIPLIEQHEKVAVSYAELRVSIEGYHEKMLIIEHKLLSKVSPPPQAVFLQQHLLSLLGHQLLRENVTKEPPSHTKGETKDMDTENREGKPKEPTMAVQKSSIKPTKVPPTEAQPITTIVITRPESP
uniref:MAK10-like protein n=1 Tax=Tanacetum cinerariifolium TaxID=118510 RepID=A0A6L2JJP2_TANCI|nr:MAK10-like protein [Tanacetum cinerariifolium]